MDDISVLAFFLGAILGMLLNVIFAPLLRRIIEYRYRLHLSVAGIAALSILVVFFVRTINAGTGDILFPVSQFLTLPVAPNFAFGVLFGSLAANWLSYIRDPDKLKEDHVRVAHRRWGFALIFVATIGIFYSTINRIVDKLQGVETPFLSLTISQQPEKTPILFYGPSANDSKSIGLTFTSTSAFFLARLTGIKNHITADEKYLMIFENNEETIKQIVARHRQLANVFEDFFEPLHKCLDMVMERAGDPEFLHSNISKLDHTFKSNPDAISLKLAKKLLGPLLDFVDDVGANEGRCSNLIELFNMPEKIGREDLRSFWENQPYGAMAIAFLIGGAGAHETAVLDLTGWLDEQYVNGKLNPESGVHEWYVIRAQLYLDRILEILGYDRARKEILDENISLMKTVYAAVKNPNGEYLRDIDNWRNNCTELEPRTTINSLAFALISQIDRRINVALKIGQYDHDLLESAKKNSAIDWECILAVHPLDDLAAHDFTSQFDAHYGELLVRMADDEIRRYRRMTNRAKAMYLEAYGILGRAVSRALEFQEEVKQRNNQSNSGLYNSILNQSPEIDFRIERAQNLRDHVAAQL